MKKDKNKDKGKNKRFISVYSQGSFSNFTIWLDTETGVNYIYHTEMYAGGMTPLLGPDGNVVITPREEIESMIKTDEE